MIRGVCKYSLTGPNRKSLSLVVAVIVPHLAKVDVAFVRIGVRYVVKP